MSDNISIGNISGGQNVIGGQGHLVNQTSGPVPSPPLAPERDSHRGTDSPVHSLHAYADIVSYSRFDAGQQELVQDMFARMLDRSLIEADVSPQAVEAQNQGDARLLSFPPGTNVAKVLAVMPRHLNAELLARNRDSAEHARLRVRLSLTMGPTAPGRTGLTGTAPIAVVRLANSAKLREAMSAAPRSCLGVIADHHLYNVYVRQRFRPDLDPDEYVLVHVSEKGFESDAWIRLFG
jgi:hypothetical protein